jgi:hypothetical protein
MIIFWVFVKKLDGLYDLRKIMNRIVKKVIDFINHIYYWKNSRSQNVYPYRLIGQKINSQRNFTTIIYKINGIYENQEAILQRIICDVKILEKFHPLDAIKMGEIALNDTIYILPEQQRKEKYIQICDAMINLIHDASYKAVDSSFFYQSLENTDLSNFDNFNIENIYGCKLVGAKLASSKSQDTKIIFTIFNKREGHEIVLQRLINDKKLLSKFHPTDAFKIGYISSGRSLSL